MIRHSYSHLFDRNHGCFVELLKFITLFCTFWVFGFIEFRFNNTCMNIWIYWITHSGHNSLTANINTFTKSIRLYAIKLTEVIVIQIFANLHANTSALFSSEINIQVENMQLKNSYQLQSMESRWWVIPLIGLRQVVNRRLISIKCNMSGIGSGSHDDSRARENQSPMSMTKISRK